MEYVIEFLLDLILEGSIEISQNRNISKWIRYPLILFIILFFLAVILLIFWVGLLCYKDNVLVGLLFIMLSIIMFLLSVSKFKKIYLEKKRDEE